MRHPVAVLVGAVLLWIAVIASLFNDPIVWWQTLLLVAVAILISGIYVSQRRTSASGG